MRSRRISIGPLRLDLATELRSRFPDLPSLSRPWRSREKKTSPTISTKILNYQHRINDNQHFMYTVYTLNHPTEEIYTELVQLHHGRTTIKRKRLLLRKGKWRLFKMAVTLYDLGSASGLKKLDEYLLTRSYITGYQASKDDLTVYAALSKVPSDEYVNVSRWYKHIDALLRISGVSGEGSGVTVKSSLVAEAAAAADDDDDDDVDLFGEETEEEKKAAEERAAALKASGKKKESGKSSVLMDIKPWDDETDMKKLEEAVRAKLVPVGYGIKKLQIMLTIVDDLVSVDSLIEEQLTAEPINEYVQSCDIVAFNKI
ncbi:hypothetical protein Ahy_A09g046317 isoform F [Arachis hypogaea]|uniref:Translation elongation factor EF1B beta/delta subunit guanine nucleotide exchange domain-containing protein n=1 Tax=Arachis hypogaea TaxID=3818 RepID=A0A445BPG4_ARAHY|nr:hypothetical protein Ahy_A09g046317 isoform F [Arachis hypogaea]